jgi:outer membrane protein assembly factor BamA
MENTANQNTALKTHERKRNLTITAMGMLLVLSIHFWAMTNSEVPDNATIQIAKLDFTEQPDDAIVHKVQASLFHEKGVKSVNYYAEQNSIVVTYNNAQNQNASLLQAVKDKAGVKLNAYVPVHAQTSGCPIHGGLNYAEWVNLIKKSII